MERPPACEDCATIVPDGAYFCPGCGRPVAPGADPNDLDRAALERRLALSRTRVRRLEIRLSALIEAEARSAASPAPRVGMTPAPSPAVPTRASSPQAAVALPDEPGSLERFLSGRILAWIGALAILIGVAFFLRLAAESGGDDEGWLTPSRRVALGAILGWLLVAVGGLSLFRAMSVPIERRRAALWAHIVLALGLGMVNVSLVAATRLYGLIPDGVGLAAALLTAAVAAFIAIRVNSQVIAAYGLVFPLFGPEFVGTDVSATSFAFVAAAVAGIIAVATIRGWWWMPVAAFFVTVPQVLAWFNDRYDEQAGRVDQVSLREGLPVLIVFWLLFAVAAVLAELAWREEIFSPIADFLLLANAAFLVAGWFVLPYPASRGEEALFLALMAAAYAAIGGGMLLTHGDRPVFGLLASAIALCSGAAAVMTRFDGSLVVAIWCAAALIFTFVHARRGDPFSAAAGLALGVLILVHLAIIDFRFVDIFEGAPHTYPFVSVAGLSLVMVLGTMAVAGKLLRTAPARRAMLAAGLLLVALVVPQELSGAALVVAWAVLYIVALAFDQHPYVMPGAEPATSTETPSTIVERPLLFPAALAALFAVLHVLLWEAPIRAMPDGLDLSTPYTDTGVTGAVPLIIAAIFGAMLSRDGRLRRANIVAALAFTPWLAPFQLWPSALAVGACIAAAAMLLLGARDESESTWVYDAGAVLLAAAALLETLAFVSTPTRLTVDYRTWDLPFPFLNGGTVAFVALIALAGLAIWTHGDHPQRRSITTGLVLVGAALAIYALSVAIVDVFQRWVRSDWRLEHDVNVFQRQSQAGLSILWSAVGGATFICGIILRSAALRIAGLALLALATIKVFLYDLGSLDTSYRVISFVGLGLLLLASSWVFQRFMPRSTV